MRIRTLCCVLIAGAVLTVLTPSTEAAEVKGVARSEEGLGHSTVSGDFDADGFADLAVGVPGDTVRRGTDLFGRLAPSMSSMAPPTG